MYLCSFLLFLGLGCRDSLLADKAIVLVIGVILGVPCKVVVVVHVEIGSSIGVVGNEVLVLHDRAGHPLNSLVPVIIKTWNVCKGGDPGLLTDCSSGCKI